MPYATRAGKRPVATDQDWRMQLQQRDLRDVDRIMLYQAPNEANARPIGASGLLVSDLYKLRLLDDDQVDLLAVIAERLEADTPFCDDELLLDAWLESFELMSSVRRATIQ